MIHYGRDAFGAWWGRREVRWCWAWRDYRHEVARAVLLHTIPCTFNTRFLHLIPLIAVFGCHYVYRHILSGDCLPMDITTQPEFSRVSMSSTVTDGRFSRTPRLGKVQCCPRRVILHLMPLAELVYQAICAVRQCGATVYQQDISAIFPGASHEDDTALPAPDSGLSLLKSMDDWNMISLLKTMLVRLASLQFTTSPNQLIEPEMQQSWS
jgi:hypothetical protein